MQSRKAGLSEANKKKPVEQVFNRFMRDLKIGIR